MGEIWAEPLIYRFCFSIRRLAHLVSKMAYSGRFCSFSCPLSGVYTWVDVLHRSLTFLAFSQIWGAFSPPIWSEPSARNNDYAIALLTLTPTLATQIVIVLPTGLGIEEQSPLSFVSF